MAVTDEADLVARLNRLDCERHQRGRKDKCFFHDDCRAPKRMGKIGTRRRGVAREPQGRTQPSDHRRLSYDSYVIVLLQEVLGWVLEPRSHVILEGFGPSLEWALALSYPLWEKQNPSPGSGEGVLRPSEDRRGLL